MIPSGFRASSTAPAPNSSVGSGPQEVGRYVENIWGIITKKSPAARAALFDRRPFVITTANHVRPIMASNDWGRATPTYITYIPPPMPAIAAASAEIAIFMRTTPIPADRAPVSLERIADSARPDVDRRIAAMRRLMSTKSASVKYVSALLETAKDGRNTVTPAPYCMKTLSWNTMEESSRAKVSVARAV